MTGHPYLDRPLRELLDAAASPEPLPAAGSIAAATGALAAALTGKVARRSRRDDADALAARADALRTRLEPVVAEDAAAYAEVLAARRTHGRAGDAMTAATNGPRTIADAAAGVAELAAELAAAGNPNLRYDASSAARLAATSAGIAADLIRANTGETEPVGDAAAVRAQEAADRARTAASEPGQR